MNIITNPSLRQLLYLNPFLITTSHKPKVRRRKKKNHKQHETLFPYFLPTLFLSFLITIHGTKSENLINSICKAFSLDDPSINNYDFCITSLQTAHANRCATLQCLAKISIRLVRYNVTDTYSYIEQLIKSRKLDPYTIQYLNVCSEFFSLAIFNVELAMKSYNAKRFDDATVQLSGVMSLIATCDDAFNEGIGVVSPLTKRTNDSSELSALALSIIYKIQTGSG